MKTIAVLTDFSEGAIHATRFSLHIAKKMKANVLLFSVKEVSTALQFMPAGELGLSSDEDSMLAAHAVAMEQELRDRSFPGSFLPNISFNADSSEIVDIMTVLMGSDEVSLIVTAPSPGLDMVAYLLSDECSRVVDWATVPVLVVPKFAPVRNPEKIAFASQLHEEDINSIAELGTLMESFSAELMVAHLNPDPSDTGIVEAETKLQNDVYRKLRCGGVYFRSIADNEKERSWNWLKANKKTDMLAVVQQAREQMTKFFTRGQNQSVTYHLTVPVMILPKRP